MKNHHVTENGIEAMVSLEFVNEKDRYIWFKFNKEAKRFSKGSSQEKKKKEFFVFKKEVLGEPCVVTLESRVLSR